MFSHLNDMFVNNKHPHLIKEGNSYFSNTLVGILKFPTNLGFDGTMCTYVFKCCNLHINNNKVLHSTFAHKRTLLIGTTIQLCPSTNLITFMFTFDMFMNNNKHPQLKE